MPTTELEAALLMPRVPRGKGQGVSPHETHSTPASPCNPPPPLGGGATVTWPKKHRKYQAPMAPKKIFYEALKLMYTVILWYSFVVQIPTPPPPVAFWMPPPPGRGMPAVVRMPACHSRRFKGERPIGAATG